MNDNLVPVIGSGPLAGGVFIGYPNPSAEVEISLSLKSNIVTAEKKAGFNDLLYGFPHTRKYLGHDELESLSGASLKDVAIVEAYFKGYGFRVKEKNIISRTLVLSGNIQAVQKALHTPVMIFEGINRQTYLSNATIPLLPNGIYEKIKKIKLFSHPVKIEFRLPAKPLADQPQPADCAVLKATAPLQGYSIAALAKAYKFPEGARGKGQVIGVVELGGMLNPADIKLYCSQQDLPYPEIVEVGTPPVITSSAAMADNAEVTLDLQIIATLAPEAKLVIYYGNTIIEAMKLIITDTANKPAVVSISWAGAESNYQAADIEEMDLIFYEASLLGITVVAASADYGAYNGKNFPNVSLPSSHPLVLGCGGSIATINNDRISSQVVWNELSGRVASGGGYSQLYAMPSYQYQAVARYPFSRLTMRGVPDIAAHASIMNGYRVVFCGKNTAIGGTSASTPFVSVLITLLNEKLGYRLGFINGHLYSLADTDAFEQIVEGNNQVYPASPCWNPCTGLGSPSGNQLLHFFETMRSRFA